MKKYLIFLIAIMLFGKIAFSQERIDSIGWDVIKVDENNFYLNWDKYRNGKKLESFHEKVHRSNTWYDWEHKAYNGNISKVVYNAYTNKLEISDKELFALSLREALQKYIDYEFQLHNSLVIEPEAKTPPDKIELIYKVIKPDTLENLADIKFIKGMQFNKSLKYGLLTDKRDNKIYKTIQIGTQTWMAENMAYKVADYCWAFREDESYVQKYGRLYNGNVAQTICPAGWHLPSDEEWKLLESFLGMGDKELANTGLRGEGVGSKLMATVSWKKTANAATNSSGFSALAAECTPIDWKWPNHPGINAYFWTSTSPIKNQYWYRILNYKSTKIDRAYNFFSQGFSVRCVKDN